MTTNTRANRTQASAAKPAWHVIDAGGKTLGRLCTEIATLLQGKHKPIYVPYLLMGDYVVVVNAEKIRVTGKKLQQKIYYRHSGYHGGLKEETLERLLQRAPTRAIKHAVKGMLPKNTIGRRALSRLKLYAGGEHPHAAQLTYQASQMASQSTKTEMSGEEERAQAKKVAASDQATVASDEEQRVRAKAAASDQATVASDEEQAQPEQADDPGTETAKAEGK